MSTKAYIDRPKITGTIARERYNAFPAGARILDGKRFFVVRVNRGDGQPITADAIAALFPDGLFGFDHVDVGELGGKAEAFFREDGAVRTTGENA